MGLHLGMFGATIWAMANVTPMDPEAAWLYAAEWGSYMTGGDPGACMYGFSEDFRVQSEEHRQNCLNWIDKECVPMVQKDPENFDADELEKLAELRAAVVASEVAA